MRTVMAPDGDAAWEEFCDRKDVGSADWKESPGEVLKTIDQLLKPHGLEIVEHDAQSDTYMFTIERRK